MVRFVILVRRHPGGAPHVEAAPPGPLGEWSRVYSTERAQVWIGPTPTRLAGTACANGYLIGAPASGADLARESGGYLHLDDSPATGAVTVRRDPSGAIAAFLAQNKEFHIVCSHVEDLLNYHCEGLEVDWAYMSFMLLNNYLPARRTGFVGVQEILAGEEASFQGGTVRISAFWTPATFYADPILNAAEARQTFRRASEASVAAWIQPYRTIMLDLSGGLDSSAMLGLLVRSNHNAEITCLNFSTSHAESDERQYARDCAQRYGVRLVEFDAERDGDVIDYRTAPRLPLMARPSITLARTGFERHSLALDRLINAEVYMTGRGGDHLFGAGLKSCYAVDHLWTRRSIPGWIACAYDAAQLTGKPVASVLKEAFTQPRGLARLRQSMPLANSLGPAETSQDLDLMAFAHPWLIDAIDKAPPAKLAQVLALIELQRHYMRYGRAEVMDEVHPFISRSTMEAALRTAAYLYPQAPQGSAQRGLQRETFKDLIPPSIYARRTKGATTSHSLRVIAHNLKYLRAMLLDGALVASGLLDRARLDERLTPGAMVYGRSLGELIKTFTAQMWVDQAQAFIDRSRDKARPRIAVTTRHP